MQVCDFHHVGVWENLCELTHVLKLHVEDHHRLQELCLQPKNQTEVSAVYLQSGALPRAYWWFSLTFADLCAMKSTPIKRLVTQSTTVIIYLYISIYKEAGG